MYKIFWVHLIMRDMVYGLEYFLSKDLLLQELLPYTHLNMSGMLRIIW
jgi:hypothetical protein